MSRRKLGTCHLGTPVPWLHGVSRGSTAQNRSHRPGKSICRAVGSILISFACQGLPVLLCDLWRRRGAGMVFGLRLAGVSLFGLRNFRKLFLSRNIQISRKVPEISTPKKWRRKDIHTEPSNEPAKLKISISIPAAWLPSAWNELKIAIFKVKSPTFSSRGHRPRTPAPR